MDPTLSEPRYPSLVSPRTSFVRNGADVSVVRHILVACQGQTGFANSAKCRSRRTPRPPDSAVALACSRRRPRTTSTALAPTVAVVSASLRNGMRRAAGSTAPNLAKTRRGLAPNVSAPCAGRHPAIASDAGNTSSLIGQNLRKAGGGPARITAAEPVVNTSAERAASSSRSDWQKSRRVQVSTAP